MRIKRSFITAFTVFCLAISAGCQQETGSSRGDSRRLQVITTLFPLYDIARSIAGEKAEVLLLLPPGTEPHNYEPRPDDIVRINRAGLFIYTNRYMEPWAEKLIQGTNSQGPTVVDASAGLTLVAAGGESHDDEHADVGEVGKDHAGRMDPHVWLDLENAVRMVDTILAGFVAKDSVNRPYFESNAAAYRLKLLALDHRYKVTLGNCRTRTLLHGGHYAFGYLARRYGLAYLAATGVTADSEPTPARLAELVKKIRSLGLKTIFAEELVSPRVADTIADETGAQVLKLHAGHNISRDELARGVTFPLLMEDNLATLAKGLQCRQ